MPDIPTPQETSFEHRQDRGPNKGVQPTRPCEPRGWPPALSDSCEVIDTPMMPIAASTVEIVAILVAAAMAGSECAVAVFFHPRISRLEDAVHVKAAASLASSLGAVMPFWYACSLLMSLAVAFLAHPTWDTTRWLAVGSAALFAATSIFSVVSLVPINNRVAHFDPDALPPDWRELRHRWDRLHGIRVGIVFIAAILLVASCVL